MIKNLLIVCGILFLPFCFGEAEEHSAIGGAATDVVAPPDAAVHDGASAHSDVSHGAGHHDVAIPTSVYLQAINFAIYFALLVFILRKPIREYFRTREENYRQALIRADHAKAAAEEKKREIELRLNQLTNSSDDSIAKAKAEAHALMDQIQQQAKEISEQLRQDAARNVEFEIERAKLELRHDLLMQSVAMSKKMLVDKMAEPDQRRLQTEFVDKIREAQS